MDKGRFDTLVRSLRAPLTRRVSLLSTLGIGGVLASGANASAKKRKKKKKKKGLKCVGGTKVCGTRCIPAEDCCQDGDCGATSLCVDGRCMTGRGTCEVGENVCDSSAHRCDVPGGTCVCFQTTAGETRCGDDATQPNAPCGACDTDADCEELFPHLPGVFCAEGGSQCGSCSTPSLSFCRLPCPS